MDFTDQVTIETILARIDDRDLPIVAAMAAEVFVHRDGSASAKTGRRFLDRLVQALDGDKERVAIVEALREYNLP